MHENDMAKRRNKELEERIAILQERLNEHLSTIYSNEIEIERLKLQKDKWSTESEGLIKERDHFKINHDRMETNFTTMEERIALLEVENEKWKLQVIEKQQEILSRVSIEKTYEVRFQEFVVKTDELKRQIDVLERSNMTLDENNKIYNEENERLKKSQEKITNNIKVMCDERNQYKDSLDAANSKVASFIEQIHHNEEMLVKVNKELEKVKNNLAQAERYSDALEIKKDAFERATSVQKRQLWEQIKTISEQVTAEKNAREKWIERYESEYKAHFETTAELMKLKTDFKTLEHRANDLEIDLNLYKSENEKNKSLYEEK